MSSGFVLKPHSTPATLLWLQANYEAVEGVCIPRNAMYNQYVEFCRAHGMMPVNAASFGKIIRQKFPGLTTRRLGTRGQSRYHYYGLAIKADANLYTQSTFSSYGANEPNYDVLCSNGKPSNRFVSNPLLRLPSTEILQGIPKSIPEPAARSIHIMYTLHCQQLIDYCVHFQFKEVKEYISHFWTGFPTHLAPLLENNSIVSMIGLCDAITYRAVSRVIIPCILLEEVPTRQAEDSIRLAESIVDWLVMSLTNMPLVLRRVKLHAARTLLRTIRRQVSLNHLGSSLRLVLTSEVHLQQMFVDWEQLDMQVVVDEILFSVGSPETDYASHIIVSYCKELEKLLRSHPQLTSLGNWMRKLVERCVAKQSEKSDSSDKSTSSGEKLRTFACNFLLMWTSVGTRILRELTLLGARSFGTFHLLYLMLTEFGAQLVESLILEYQIQRLTENVALGNPVDCDDFEVGILCDAQCPCKTRCSAEQQQQQQHEGKEEIEEGAIFGGTTVLTGGPENENHFHGNHETGSEFLNNHVHIPARDVKIRYGDPRGDIIESNNFCQTVPLEMDSYYDHHHPHHHHHHNHPPTSAQHVASTRPSYSFQEMSPGESVNGGRAGDYHHQQHHHHHHHYSRSRNEYRSFPTSPELTCTDLVVVSDDQQRELPATGTVPPGYLVVPSSASSSTEYCTTTTTTEQLPSESNTNWYTISSSMSGGECYDNFYATETSSQFMQPQSPLPIHHNPHQDHHHHHQQQQQHQFQ